MRDIKAKVATHEGKSSGKNGCFPCFAEESKAAEALCSEMSGKLRELAAKRLTHADLEQYSTAYINIRELKYDLVEKYSSEDWAFIICHQTDSQTDSLLGNVTTTTTPTTNSSTTAELVGVDHRTRERKKKEEVCTNLKQAKNQIKLVTTKAQGSLTRKVSDGLRAVQNFTPGIPIPKEGPEKGCCITIVVDATGEHSIKTSSQADFNKRPELIQQLKSLAFKFMKLDVGKTVACGPDKPYDSDVYSS